MGSHLGRRKVMANAQNGDDSREQFLGAVHGAESLLGIRAGQWIPRKAPPRNDRTGERRRSKTLFNS